MDYLIDAKQNIIINPKSNMKEVKSKNEKKKKNLTFWSSDLEGRYHERNKKC
jgi:hypothetical protein